MNHRALRALALGTLALGCGSSATPTHSSQPDAGSMGFKVPEASPNECDAASADAGADPECTRSAAAISFARDVSPIFASCAGEVCHLGWSYDELVNVHSTQCCDHRFIVQPNAPSRSALVQALRGTNDCVGQMPPGGPLPQADIDTITAWVCQGAPRN